MNGYSLFMMIIFIKKYQKTIDNVEKIVYTYTCLNDKYAPLAQLVRATGS